MRNLRYTQLGLALIFTLIALVAVIGASLLIATVVLGMPRSPTLTSFLVANSASLGFFILMIAAGGFGFYHLRKAVIEGGRHAKPLCTVCGYDIRASPDRCPECGTLVKKK